MPASASTSSSIRKRPWKPAASRTLIGTDALNMIPGVERGNGRSPAIMGDAAHAVLVREAAGFHGRFLIDDEVLAEAGIGDLSGYAIDPGQPLLPDLFLD